MIELREHQSDIVLRANILWLTVKNILAVLPTGAGKSYVMAAIARTAYTTGDLCFVFAHRDILITQLSDSLCDMGVHHSFICSDKTRKNVTNANLEKHGDSYFSESSPVIVVSVDTFNSRVDSFALQNLIPRCKWWLMDEAHHVQDANKWGRCINALPVTAKGMGVTATPIRSDGHGLGATSHGVFNSLLVGASQTILMQRGYLSLYKLFVPPTKLDTTGMKVGKSGDWSERELAKRTDTPDITGDAVQHYQEIAGDKQAIAFCVNIAHSNHVAAQFSAAGIPAVSLSSKTPVTILLQALKDFKAGLIRVLVNCDLFGEGFDVPAVEVVIMLRKTEAYSLFKQQFGRCLRPSPGKEYGIVIDHVGNIKRHCIYGNPHDDPEWTLEPRVKSNDDGERSLGRVCPECFNFYIPDIGSRRICPDCGHEETRDEINKAEQDFQAEDGKLVELEVDFVNQLLAKKKSVDMDVSYITQKFANAPAHIRQYQVNNHVKRQYAQTILRGHIQEWCVNNNPDNLYDKKTMLNKFEIEFGVNVLKAHTLSERLALELTNSIRRYNYASAQKTTGTNTPISATTPTVTKTTHEAIPPAPPAPPGVFQLFDPNATNATTNGDNLVRGN